MRPGGRIAVARTGRALPIARSLSSNTRSVLAGRCACTYSHSVPVTDVLASIPWYSSLAVHSGCCAPIPDLAAGASERGPPTNGQGFLAGR